MLEINNRLLTYCQKVKCCVFACVCVCVRERENWENICVCERVKERNYFLIFSVINSVSDEPTFCSRLYQTILPLRFIKLSFFKITCAQVCSRLPDHLSNKAHTILGVKVPQNNLYKSVVVSTRPSCYKGSPIKVHIQYI